MWRFTRGHPLSLVLAAESALHAPAGLDLPGRQDVVQALVEWLTNRAFDQQHLAAFEVACLVEEIDEPTLAAVLELTSARDAAGWLSSLPFVETREGRLSVHDLVRQAVLARLAQREPARLAQLFARAMRFILAELAQKDDPVERARIGVSVLSMCRHHPTYAGFFRVEESAALRVELARESEYPSLVGLVEMHEGAEQASAARRWLTWPARQVWAIRDEETTPAGLVLVRAPRRRGP